MFQDNVLEIGGEGFLNLMDFQGWRIARNGFKNGVNDTYSVKTMGCHKLTKEVFVLLQGDAFLLTASDKEFVGEIKCQKLEKNNIYIVNEKTWHFLALYENGLTLIIENSGTSKDNSTVIELTNKQAEEALMILNEYKNIEIL